MFGSSQQKLENDGWKQSHGWISLYCHLLICLVLNYMYFMPGDPVIRFPGKLSRFCDQVWIKPVCSATSYCNRKSNKKI